MLKRHKYVCNDFADSDVIWKYYKLSRFLDLLDQQKLFFTRVDKFSDFNEFPVTERDAKLFNMSLDECKSEFERIKRQAFVNCWRIYVNESFGMWSAYSDIETGIAIKTTVRNLIAACSEKENDRDITIGKVHYIDDQSDGGQMLGMPLNTCYIIFSKIKPYEYENELRLYFEDWENREKEYLCIDVNLQILIEEIRVSAGSHPLYARMVDSLLKEKGIDVPVVRSIIK